jgi:hypothetical protein
MKATSNDFDRLFAVKGAQAIFSSKSDHWATPSHVYEDLNESSASRSTPAR